MTRRRIVALRMRLTWLAAAVALPAAALADPWGTGTSDTGPKPDNLGHYACFPEGSGSLGNTFFSAVYRALGESEVGTGVDAVIEACTSNSDVRVVRRDLGTSLLGRYSCQEFNSSGKCNVGLMEINFNYYFNNYVRDADLINHLQHDVCHELGHSLGLTHGGTTDCMRKGDHTLHNFSTHHRDHIRNQN